MPLPFFRVRARIVIVGALLLSAGSARAEIADEHPHAAAGELLTLALVQRLALEDQPQLVEQAARVRNLNQRAVAAGQLPDPQLMVGVQDLPTETNEAYSLRRDDFTMLTVGVSQEFPLATKRALRSDIEKLKARGAEDQLEGLQRRIQLEAGRAFLDVYQSERAIALTEAMLAEAERNRAAAEIAYRAGRIDQAELLAASLTLALLHDKAAEYRQMAGHARLGLARWIGAAANQATDAVLPESPALPQGDALAASLRRHPALRAYARDQQRAEADWRLAQQAYKPDWRVAVEYGHRLGYADLVTAKLGIDLPFFTHDRQDRDAAAAREAITEAQARQDDALRELTAEASGAYHDLERLQARAQSFDAHVLPLAQARVDAALASYGAGRVTLAALLDARRNLLETQLQRLALAVDTARAGITLNYYAKGSP